MTTTDALNLYEEACQLIDENAKLELLEEVIALAETQKQAELAQAARASFIDAASFSGRPEQTMVVFDSYLTASDENDAQEPYELLWRYKWALHQLRETSNATTDHVDRKLTDFEHRLLQADYSLRPFFYQKLAFALHSEQLNEAQKHYQAWQLSSRDALADCLACERHLQVQYFLALGDFSSAFKKAASLLNNELSCHEVPQITYALLIRAQLEAKNLSAAQQLHKASYAHIRDSSQLAALGNHLLFLSVNGELKEATQLVKDKLDLVLQCQTLESKFYFLLGLDAFCQKMLSEKQIIPLGLDPFFKNITNLKDLNPWCKENLKQLFKNFDARNHTNAFQTRLQKNQQVIKHFL